jgi:hypothetical protein
MGDGEAAIEYIQQDLNKRMGDEPFQYLLQQSTLDASMIAAQEH